MYPTKQLITTLLASCTMMSAAHASESTIKELLLVYGDQENISLATGYQQPLRKAPAVASVITAQDIRAMGATDMDQVLQSVPGLHVSFNNIAAKPIYSFRGIYTQQNPQVLMLVNGIPITNVFWGDRSQLWGGMPVENIARIEVIRGPGSALYGADAFSGVINVVTKQAQQIRGTEYGVRTGSFDSQYGWIQHGSKHGAFSQSYFLSAGKTDGYSNRMQRDAQTSWDQIFNTSRSHAPGPLNNQRKTIDARADLAYDSWRFRAGWQQREVGIGAGLAASLDPEGTGHGSRVYLDLSYRKEDWQPDWDLNATLGYFNIKDKPGDPAYTLFPAGAFNNAFPNGMIGNPGHYEQHSHLSAEALYRGIDRHRISMGAGHRIEDMYRTIEHKNFDAGFAPLPGGVTDVSNDPALVFILPQKRHLSYLYLQDEWNFSRDWVLTAGVRHDNYSDFGGTTNPRIALVWDADYDLTIKALHGTAFRAPSFAEQYSQNNPVVIGDPDIQPETIRTSELAFLWQASGKLETSLNFFHYQMDDIIRPTGSMYSNSGKQSGHGLELEATYDPLYNLRLTGHLALQRSKDDISGQNSGLAPQQNLYLRANWRFKTLWQLGATLNHVGDRQREPQDNRAPVADYTTVDLLLKREQLLPGWDLQGMVHNLFNERMYEPTVQAVGITAPGVPVTISDLPRAERAVYLQLRYKM